MIYSDSDLEQGLYQLDNLRSNISMANESIQSAHSMLTYNIEQRRIAEIEFQRLSIDIARYQHNQLMQVRTELMTAKLDLDELKRPEPVNAYPEDRSITLV